LSGNRLYFSTLQGGRDIWYLCTIIFIKQRKVLSWSDHYMRLYGLKYKYVVRKEV